MHPPLRHLTSSRVLWPALVAASLAGCATLQRIAALRHVDFARSAHLQRGRANCAPLRRTLKTRRKGSNTLPHMRSGGTPVGA